MFAREELCDLQEMFGCKNSEKYLAMQLDQFMPYGRILGCAE